MQESIVTNEQLIKCVTQTINQYGDELTRLDQAIGDGDHGINMVRGFDAVLAEMASLTHQPLGDAIAKAGMILVMKVGGASGPLYGSFCMAFGKVLGSATLKEMSLASIASAFTAGVDAVMRRGKSEAGQKTMLDVLVPVADALNTAKNEKTNVGPTLGAVKDAAAQGLARTKPMRATKGRAAFLGDRSVGHLDPGARSACVLITAICDLLGNG